MPARAREITDDGMLTFSDPIWTTRATVWNAVSPSDLSGTAFLSGDAGHVTLPLRGQGTNVRLHHSVGLA